MCETGTDQQMTQLHVSLVMMVIMMMRTEDKRLDKLMFQTLKVGVKINLTY